MSIYLAHVSVSILLPFLFRGQHSIAKREKRKHKLRKIRLILAMNSWGKSYQVRSLFFLKT
jgi:hypothetical protein